MYAYRQSTGELTDLLGILLWTGYSGKDVGKNNPNMEAIPDVGPIPQGLYRINAAIDTTDHGPVVLPLTPNDWNRMYGRSGFLIHGDSIEHPGEASEGCIIMPRSVREAIARDLPQHNLLAVIY